MKFSLGPGSTIRWYAYAITSCLGGVGSSGAGGSSEVSEDINERELDSESDRPSSHENKVISKASRVVQVSFDGYTYTQHGVHV